MVVSGKGRKGRVRERRCRVSAMTMMLVPCCLFASFNGRPIDRITYQGVREPRGTADVGGHHLAGVNAYAVLQWGVAFVG
jgi:hypothetical protein